MIVVVTTILDHIYREEGATVIRDGLVPLQLIERLHTQAISQTLRDIKHIYRNQAFLDFRARPAEGRGIQWVDRVDAITDEGTLAPTDHLPPDTDGSR